jgi:hypothetical protein
VGSSRDRLCGRLSDSSVSTSCGRSLGSALATGSCIAIITVTALEKMLDLSWDSKRMKIGYRRRSGKGLV